MNFNEKEKIEIKNEAEKFKEKFLKHNYAVMQYDMKDNLLDYYDDKNREFYHHLISFGIKSEKRGNNHIFYDYNKISMNYVVDLFDLLKEVYDYSRKVDEKDEPVHDLIFRGHAHANYQLYSSLIRDKRNLENEDKYYFDTIKSNPEAFRKARYHLDYLKTIQHYRGVSRIMDIGANVLITTYFAVEKLEGDKHKKNMGELIIFDKNNIVDSKEKTTGEKSQGSIEYKVATKRFNSDTVEILASLAALNKSLKDDIEKDACKVIEKYYAKNICENKMIEEFNNCKSVEKLVHEVGQVRLNFKNVIDPRHLFNIYFSDSTFDNERITNQAGEFIIHGFINSATLDKKLNEIRLKDSNKNQIYLIDDTAKSKIRKQLEMIGIKSSTIYPSLENTVKDIYK